MIQKSQTRHLTTLSLLALLLVFSHTQDIVDFTYSHYLQEGSSGSASSRKIDNIKPTANAFEKYEFPQACKIVSKLDSSAVDAISEK